MQAANSANQAIRNNYMDEFKQLRAMNKLKGKRFTEVIEEYVSDI